MMNRTQAYLDQKLEAINEIPVSYPTLDIIVTTRVYKDRVDQNNLPLSRYTHKVTSNDVTKIFDQRVPKRSFLRSFQLSDGLIYQLAELNNHMNPQDGRTKMKVKVLICVCMYNQGQTAINLTLNGIYQNLPLLQKQGISADEIAVVLIQDGILKLVQNRFQRTYTKGADSMVNFYRTLDQLQKKKKCDLQERINIILDQYENQNRKGIDLQNRDFPISIEKNIALLYQNLWKPSMTDSEGLTPDTSHYLKLLSCFKHINGTKLSSHLWFFEGFCRYINPEYVVMLDVGTKPQKDAIVNLLKGFTDKNVGGVTGFMTIDESMKSQQSNEIDKKQDSFYQCLRRNFFSVEKAQQYEYILSHFFDKAAESALGFLHVLPGAWSAYRYKALIKSDRYEPNLLEHSYFKMLLNPNIEEKDVRQANMYLAQDRLLTLGIYCQSNEKYYLKYIPNAVARTDPMTNHQDLLKQRRRWMNSGMFGFLHEWKHYMNYASLSSHSWFDRYFRLSMSMFISLLSLGIAYISPALLFYLLFTTTFQIGIRSQYAFLAARIISITFAFVYLVGIAGSLMGNAWLTKAKYISIIMTILMCSLVGLFLYNVIRVYLGIGTTGIDLNNYPQASMLAVMIINLGTFIFNLALHAITHPGFVWRLISNQMSYISYQGSYAVTMFIHSYCNIDDVSWGTKGTLGGASKKYENQKIKFVIRWILINSVVAYILLYIDLVVPRADSGENENRRVILLVIAYYSTFYYVIRASLAIFHQIKWIITVCGRPCQKPLESQERLQQVKRYWKKSNLQYSKINNN